MCYNQTAMASEPSAHVQNPNSYMHPLPCCDNATNRYNTSSSNNTTYVMFGSPQEDVSGVGYIILFSGLVLLLGMLYCLAMRAGMIEASIRREQIAAAIRHRESYSYDTMTAKERRQYIDRVLKVKTFGVSDSKNTSTEPSAVAPEAANVSIAISKPLQDESGDSATDIEDLSNDGCLDDVSLNDEDEDDNPKLEPCCAICLEKFRSGDEVSYSHDPLCSHEYHTHCIVEWLLKHMNCPYCRRSYIPIPPSVKKASLVITLPAEPHPSSSWDHAAMHPVVSSSSPQILHSSSPSVEPTFDIEMGASEEALSRHSIPDGDERIAI